MWGDSCQRNNFKYIKRLWYNYIHYIVSIGKWKRPNCLTIRDLWIVFWNLQGYLVRRIKSYDFLVRSLNFFGKVIKTLKNVRYVRHYLFFFILYPNSGRINMVKDLAVNFLFFQLTAIILQSIKFRNYYISICIYVIKPIR